MRPLLLLVFAAAALAAASSASPHHHPTTSAGFIQPRAAAPPPLSPGPRPPLSAAASAPAPDTPVEGKEEPSAALVFERWFRGRFDNAGQVAEERAQGMAPGEGGGHEQIHCVLEPLPNLRPGSLGGGERFLGGWTDGWVGTCAACIIRCHHSPLQ